MASGKKTGGRTKGTPNKKTEDLRNRLNALGCDPIEGMVTIAQDEQNPPELRGRMYAELSQYLYPKRKAIEMTGDTTTTYIVSAEPLSVEEWTKQYKPSGDHSQAPKRH